jgi:hypothetical protein
MGSKSDKLLQLTGFAVHLHSRLLIRAEEIDLSKLGSRTNRRNSRTEAG